MQLVEVRRAMQQCAAEFDASRLTAGDAAGALEHAAAVKNMAAGIEAMAATRLSETKAWRIEGDRSPGHHLARKTGVPVSQANATLRTAERLSKAPATVAALRAGEVSITQAGLIADAVADDPHAELLLLEQARVVSFGELRAAVARVKAKAVDLEERRRRIHAERAVRTWCDVDGRAHLHWTDNPERIASFRAVLDEHAEAVVRAMGTDTPRERYEAYVADAMMALADATRSGSGSAPSTARRRDWKLLVRIDLPRWLGCPADGDETCEIVGYGPVAVSAVREMLESGDPFLAAVITSGRQVLGVAHLGRKFTAHQRTALEWLSPTCAVEGCNALARLELDHREDWAKTHISLVDLADRLCHPHHALKTRDGWALVDGTGTRAFVPPDDPRHPSRTGSADANAPPGAA